MADLSLQAQAKLLRFLEEGEFYRLGETNLVRVNTRVIAATNKDLDRMMADGSFRKDLYFRLAVVVVHLPSLNERYSDIPLLAKHFLVAFAKKLNKKFTALSPEAMAALKTHDWSGNVRELRNVIERGVLVGKGPILETRDLGIGTQTATREAQKAENDLAFPPLPPSGIDMAALQTSLEVFYMKEALRMAEGNVSKAAKLLHMNHHTFRYRRKRLGVR